MPEEASIFSDLEKIPCFKKSFTFGIASGVVSGLATFIYTSRVKRSTDIAVFSFGAATLGYWMYCRYNWTKEYFLQQKMNSELHEVMLKEGRSGTSNT